MVASEYNRNNLLGGSEELLIFAFSLGRYARTLASRGITHEKAEEYLGKAKKFETWVLLCANSELLRPKGCRNPLTVFIDAKTAKELGVVKMPKLLY
jgi:hypothetical protein